MTWPPDSRQPTWAVAMENRINKQLGKIMALVQVDQTALNTFATELETAIASVKAEIAALQQQLPAADVSGLTQAVTDLEALEPPAPSS